ncbi:MAG TPA: NAD(P) transhydrogenase subunit alpha [Verrucomicrobiota bacterium]|nr:NAD(P) transhydrogenase subunit alpha [Verrucomicrobiota bacterium]HNU50515.1 NAD(P) transhydrogenase subunit alpha [Verrucomicrobiota bacterium]
MGTDLLVLLGTFAAALAVGYLLISKVPPLLHTPLMSMTNAVSAVTLLGALLIFKETGDPEPGAAALALVGGIAIATAVFNVVGGFAITDRMLKLFRKHR